MSTVNENNEHNEFSELFKEGEERILIAAWTLPNEGELTDTQRQETMENFHSYIKRNDLTIEDVARQLGSPTINENKALRRLPNVVSDCKLKTYVVFR